MDKASLPKTFCCTGRFQKVHAGHLAYLNAGAGIAEKLNGELFILTGPLDYQLEGKNTVPFAYRRVLLSVLTGLPERNILPQYGSPHLNAEETRAWRDLFFDSLNRELSKRAHDQLTAEITLLCVRKDADVRTYLPGTSPQHYSELIRDRFPEVAVMDVTGVIDESVMELSSSGNTPPDSIPAASLAASLLLRNKSPSVSSFRRRLRTIHEKFGLDPCGLEEIDANLSMMNLPEALAFLQG